MFRWICVYLLFSIGKTLTAFSYTTASRAPIRPSSITCDDGTGCEINCNGTSACEMVAINATSASYLTLTASGDNVLNVANIHCPSNAQSSRKLIATGDGQYHSFSPIIKCPRNQSQPSCIIKLRSDSSPYWSIHGGPIMLSAILYIDSINELEFQCDATSNWDALFSANTTHNFNNIYYHGGSSAVCGGMLLDSYSSSNFFDTNVLKCVSGSNTNLLDGKRCVPWDTDAPSPLPSQSPTNALVILPTTLLSVLHVETTGNIYNEFTDTVVIDDDKQMNVGVIYVIIGGCLCCILCIYVIYKHGVYRHPIADDQSIA